VAKIEAEYRALKKSFEGTKNAYKQQKAKQQEKVRVIGVSLQDAENDKKRLLSQLDKRTQQLDRSEEAYSVLFKRHDNLFSVLMNAKTELEENSKFGKRKETIAVVWNMIDDAIEADKRS
jgi:transcription elongation GreA/GreB family factor